jgi:uncharacterized protein YdhG (YjbR/CyaY superfamily)
MPNFDSVNTKGENFMNAPDEILNYLRRLPPIEQRALKSVRHLILQLAPTLEERLSRGVPFFYYKGKRAVGFRSSKNHLSFFIMDGRVLHDLREELSAYDHSSTVVRFTVANPLPDKLIKRLVLARISEIERQIKKSKLIAS